MVDFYLIRSVCNIIKLLYLVLLLEEELSLDGYLFEENINRTKIIGNFYSDLIKSMDSAYSSIKHLLFYFVLVFLFKLSFVYAHDSR